MYSLFRKEFGLFFSTVTGYLVVIVFLLANSLFLWIIPGSYNITENGYSSLEPLFVISPWIFLFLVPAVTMRMISEELRMGTLELLLVRPLTEMQIILAKYFAAICLVIIAIIPTFVFFYSIYVLGNPIGNIDTGGTWGSYLGLFFLAAIYASTGIFASSVTDNQIVAFIISVLLSVFLFIGFDLFSSISDSSAVAQVISSIGLNEHYKSISRGVLDSGDIVYFVGVVAIFLLLARMVLQSRKW